ncbi:MAG: molybdopterin-dependent oxidoreductase [Gammaproteobacteria bacterium]|nr:molybdopterin-dependent oxidoreductase [Gammaproteobacteria bacterium]
MPDTSAVTASVCPYCGVGCGVLIETTAARVTAVHGDPAHPANRGRLCSKGAALGLTMGPQGRALHPELRRTRAETRAPAAWDTTLDWISEHLVATVQRHGPDAIGFYISGQLLTEDYYVFNKLAKGLFGTNNIDTNSRLCMSSAVTGYKATLGADAPPACYDDIEHADLFFIAGANPAYAHPILYRRLEAARASARKPRVIVVDPRRTLTAAEADLHLQILPGTDVALFNGLLHLLLWDGKLDYDYITAHTEGFLDLKAAVHQYPPTLVSQICGIPEALLRQAAQWFGESRAVLSLYCQGLNQSTHGTANNAALINLHLATGQIGRPGAGPFSLTGQPNAMGGREVGGMATLLSGHRDLANPAHRAEVAAAWGVQDVPAAPGKTAIEMFEAVRAGQIKILWIACTNPAQSLPNQSLVRAALERAELVIVQEAYTTTETTAYADVLLPAATWGEKDGTMTNSERRIARVRAAVPPPGSARPDWEIVVDVARRCEAALRPDAPSLFPYATVEDVFNEHRALTRGRDLDITGISYELLESGPQQWPYRSGETVGAARLYVDGHYPTPTGRAHFYSTHHAATAEPPDARFPLILNTGRLRDQWHGMTRTGTVTRLFNHAPEPVIELHPQDLQRRGLSTGDLVSVRSRRGAVTLKVDASDSVSVGQSFIPMHWGSQWWNGLGVNGLTQDAFDPVSKQPELKAAAINLEAANLPWRLMVMVDGGADHDACDLTRLRRYLEKFDYASCGRFGSTHEGLILRAAHRSAPSADLLASLQADLGLQPSAELMAYEDRARGMSRLLRVHGGRLVAVFLAGDITGFDWLQEWLDAGHSTLETGARLLAPSALPPRATPLASRVICGCENVTEAAIESALKRVNAHEPAVYGYLQRELKCGTGCGSCGPEIRRLIADRTAAATG